MYSTQFSGRLIWKPLKASSPGLGSLVDSIFVVSLLLKGFSCFSTFKCLEGCECPFTADC